jgi:hypothetical protein
MRSRVWFACGIAAAVAVTSPVRAQDASARTGGLSAGDYLRVGGGFMTPVNPQGSLRDWQSGPSFAVTWENWQPGPGGAPSRVAFGIGAVYNRLSLNQSQFLADFTPPFGGTTTSASAKSATIIEINSNVRIRIPAPYLVPAVTLGFGFINWAPGKVTYASSNGTNGTATQQHRSGAEVTIGGGVDAPLFGRYALFADAQYVYGFTSFGRGLASPGGTCASNGCDPLKNTSVAAVRGGLRVRFSR